MLVSQEPKANKKEQICFKAQGIKLTHKPHIQQSDSKSQLQLKAEIKKHYNSDIGADLQPSTHNQAIQIDGTTTLESIAPNPIQKLDWSSSFTTHQLAELKSPDKLSSREQSSNQGIRRTSVQYLAPNQVQDARKSKLTSIQSSRDDLRDENQSQLNQSFKGAKEGLKIPVLLPPKHHPPSGFQLNQSNSGIFSHSMSNPKLSVNQSKITTVSKLSSQKIREDWLLNQLQVGRKDIAQSSQLGYYRTLERLKELPNYSQVVALLHSLNPSEKARFENLARMANQEINLETLQEFNRANEKIKARPDSGTPSTPKPSGDCSNSQQSETMSNINLESESEQKLADRSMNPSLRGFSEILNSEAIMGDEGGNKFDPGSTNGFLKNTKGTSRPNNDLASMDANPGSAQQMHQLPRQIKNYMTATGIANLGFDALSSPNDSDHPHLSKDLNLKGQKVVPQVDFKISTITLPDSPPKKGHIPAELLKQNPKPCKYNSSVQKSMPNIKSGKQVMKSINATISFRKDSRNQKNGLRGSHSMPDIAPIEISKQVALKEQEQAVDLNLIFDQNRFIQSQINLAKLQNNLYSQQKAYYGSLQNNKFTRLKGLLKSMSKFNLNKNGKIMKRKRISKKKKKSARKGSKIAQIDSSPMLPKVSVSDKKPIPKEGEEAEDVPLVKMISDPIDDTSKLNEGAQKEFAAMLRDLGPYDLGDEGKGSLKSPIIGQNPFYNFQSAVENGITKPSNTSNGNRKGSTPIQANPIDITQSALIEHDLIQSPKTNHTQSQSHEGGDRRQFGGPLHTNSSSNIPELGTSTKIPSTPQKKVTFDDSPQKIKIQVGSDSKVQNSQIWQNEFRPGQILVNSAPTSSESTIMNADFEQDLADGSKLLHITEEAIPGQSIEPTPDLLIKEEIFKDQMEVLERPSSIKDQQMKKQNINHLRKLNQDPLCPIGASPDLKTEYIPESSAPVKAKLPKLPKGRKRKRKRNGATKHGSRAQPVSNSICVSGAGKVFKKSLTHEQRVGISLCGILSQTNCFKESDLAVLKTVIPDKIATQKNLMLEKVVLERSLNKTKSKKFQKKLIEEKKSKFMQNRI